MGLEGLALGLLCLLEPVTTIGTEGLDVTPAFSNSCNIGQINTSCRPKYPEFDATSRQYLARSAHYQDDESFNQFSVTGDHSSFEQLPAFSFETKLRNNSRHRWHSHPKNTRNSLARQLDTQRLNSGDPAHSGFTSSSSTKPNLPGSHYQYGIINREQRLGATAPTGSHIGVAGQQFRTYNA